MGGLLSRPRLVRMGFILRKGRTEDLQDIEDKFHFALDDGHYSPPPEGQDTRSFASSAWYGCSGGGRHKVAVRVRAPLATVVEETKWHPTQRIEHMDDGSITISAVVPDLDEIGRWVMASAPYAEVLEPLSLRESISALCAMVHKGHS